MKWILLLPLILTGCGTVRNLAPVWDDQRPHLSPPAEVYGGVHSNAAEIQTAAKNLQQFPAPGTRVLANTGVVVSHSVDLPFSAVGDTVTLPFTYYARFQRGIFDQYFPERQNRFRQSLVLAHDPAVDGNVRYDGRRAYELPAADP